MYRKVLVPSLAAVLVGGIYLNAQAKTPFRSEGTPCTTKISLGFERDGPCPEGDLWSVCQGLVGNYGGNCVAVDENMSCQTVHESDPFLVDVWCTANKGGE